MVENGVRLADIGTDHGYLVIRLLQDGIVSGAVAADIRPGPLSRARENVREAGAEGVSFRLCDGLAGISPEEADTIVIAGMGGETIAGILDRAPWTKMDKQLLLQPMSRAEILRKFLAENGYRILEERIVEDAGKLYSVLRAVGGESEAYNESEYRVGRYDLICRERLFLPLIEQQEKKISTALKGLAISDREEDQARRQYLGLVLSQLMEMREKYAESK